MTACRFTDKYDGPMRTVATREKVTTAGRLRRPAALFAPRGALTIAGAATGTNTGFRA